VEFFDTHCHIHEAGPLSSEQFVQNKWAEANITDPQPLIDEAHQAGVTRLMCVGCTLADSELAVKLAVQQRSCFASIGIHPHEAKDHLNADVQQRFTALAEAKEVVAIGECGLDYYYNHSSKEDQLQVLDFQLNLAQRHELPLIFHVREAFDDFWPILDQFPGLKGVVHSFTANVTVLEEVLSRGLYVGLNGILTFTKDAEQLAMAKAVPLDKMLLETDAPFLTPTPYRGTICQPKHVRTTAEFLADLRQQEVSEIASATTNNARQLFNL
jgi:TatD DNase family protein